MSLANEPNLITIQPENHSVTAKNQSHKKTSIDALTSRITS